MIKKSGLIRWAALVLVLTRFVAYSVPKADTFLTMTEDAYLGSFTLTAPFVSIKKDYQFPGLCAYSPQTNSFGGMSGINRDAFPNQLYGGFLKAKNGLQYGCVIANPELSGANSAVDSTQRFGLDGGLWGSRLNGRVGYSLYGNINNTRERESSGKWFQGSNKTNGESFNGTALLRLPSGNHFIRICGTGHFYDQNTREDNFQISSGASSRMRNHVMNNEYIGGVDFIQLKHNSAMMIGGFTYVQKDFDSMWSVNNTVLYNTYKELKTLGVGLKGTIELSVHPMDNMVFLYGAELSGTWESLREFNYPTIRHFRWYYGKNGGTEMLFCFPVSLNLQPCKSLSLISSWKIAESYSENHNTKDSINNRSHFSLRYQGAPLCIVWKMKSADIAIIPEFSRVVSGLEVRVRW